MQNVQLKIEEFENWLFVKRNFTKKPRNPEAFYFISDVVFLFPPCGGIKGGF